MRTVVSELLINWVRFTEVKWKVTIFIGLIAAAFFVAFGSMGITAQGLYYDELHQATASFAYKGVTPEMFSSYAINGVPILNMPYSGAIKTGVYGLFLRYSGSHFSVSSWRLVGIIFVSAGLFFFGLLARRGLSPGGMLVFVLLILTDMTIVLATRHDWGPVALALLLRLLIIATWIHGETREFSSLRNTFVLGLLAGIAIFEKVSSAILLLPLLSILILSSGRRSTGHWLSCLGGCTIGGILLIYVNLDSLLRTGVIISLNNPAVEREVSMRGFLQYIGEYVSLGSGDLLKSFILGITDSTAYSKAEIFLVFALLSLIAGIVVRYSKQSKLLRMSGIMLISYWGVGIGLYLSPLPTWVHHWVTGTPFQYAAITLAVAGLFGRDRIISPSGRFLRVAILTGTVLLLISRLPGFLAVEDSLVRGDASLTWDPSLTKVGLFAAERANEAVFIAADWGVATQMYSLTDGQPGLIYQPVWNYKGLGDIEEIVEKVGKSTLYIVVKKPNSGVNPSSTERIMRDIQELQGWEEVPVEKETADWRAVGIRKFVRIGADSR